MRMSRRAGLLFSDNNLYPTPAELFNKMTIKTTAGKDSSSPGNVSISNSNVSNSYVLKITNGTIELSDERKTHSITNCYGGTLAVLTFSTYTNDEVMGAWNRFAKTIKDFTESSEKITVKLHHDMSNKFLILARNKYLDIRDGTTFDRIKGTSTEAATSVFPASEYISMYEVYGGTIVAIN